MIQIKRIGSSREKPDTEAEMSEILQNDGCGEIIPAQYIICTCVFNSKHCNM